MRKIVFGLIIICLILLTGCEKNNKFEGQCYFMEENGLGYCFSEEGNKGYFVLKYEGKYRGTNSEEDMFTWEQSSDNIITIKYKSSYRSLVENVFAENENELKYKLNDADKTLTSISEDEISEQKLLLSDIKLSDVEFDNEINIPVTFMGEKAEDELSNYYMTTLSYFTLPIKNFEVNEDYVFKLFGQEVFYLPLKKFNEINNNDYMYIYRNLLSKYRVCYETDSGKNYYNQVDTGYYITEDISFINVDYCNKMGIEDNIDVKKLYSSFAGSCFAKNGRELMCFNNEMTKVYFEKTDNYVNHKLKTYNLEIKDGLYTYNNIPIIILNSKSASGNYNKLSVGSDNYSLFGDTASMCISCPEYIEPE